MSFYHLTNAQINILINHYLILLHKNLGSRTFSFNAYISYEKQAEIIFLMLVTSYKCCDIELFCQMQRIVK